MHTKHLTLVTLLLVGCAAPTSGEREMRTNLVSIVSPAGEALVGGVVDVVIDVVADRSSERVELWADDTLMIASWDGGIGGVSADFDTAALDDGLHSLRVTVTWPDGTRSDDEHVIIVDNGGPTVRIDEPFERVFHEDGAFSFAATVSDSSRIVALRLRVDGRTAIEASPITRNQYVVTVDPLEYLAEGASEGRVVLTAEAEDAGGNVSTVERTIEIVSRRQWTFATLGRVWEAPELLWDGAVAVVTSEGVLLIVEADGTERCHVRADGERGTSSPTYAPAANALVWGTTLRLRVTDADTCAQLYVDALTGEFVAKPVVTEAGMVHATTFDGTLVSFRPDGTGRSTASLSGLVAGGSAIEMRSSIVEGPGGDLFIGAKVGSTGGALFAIRAATGAMEVADLTAPIDGDALVTDSGVFVGAADGSVYSYGLDLTRRWVVPASDGLSVLTHPVFDGDVVIVGDGEGRVHGRDPDTGDVVWEYDALLERSPTGVGLIGRAGLAIGPAGDVAFGDALGMIHVLGPGGYARFRAQVAGGGRGDGIVARPAVTSTLVFIGAENQTLTAFALR